MTISKWIKLIDNEGFEFVVNIDNIILIESGWGNIHIQGMKRRTLNIESLNKLMGIMGLDIHD